MAILFADRPSFRSLGLALLAQLFNDDQELIVELHSDESDVSSIKYKQDFYEKRHLDGLITDTTCCNYIPNSVEEYPFSDAVLQNNELPHVFFEHSQTRTTDQEELRVFGSKASVGNLATLLLDFSQPHNSQPDVQLQCHFGITGVADGSAEIALVLPEAEEWWC